MYFLQKRYEKYIKRDIICLDNNLKVEVILQLHKFFINY